MPKLTQAFKAFFDVLASNESVSPDYAAFRKALSSWVEQQAKIWLKGLDVLKTQTELTEPYKQHPTVYKAISQIGRNIARVEREYFKENVEQDKPVEVKNYPILEVLKNPNDEMTETQLIEGTIINMELKGDAHWALSYENGQIFPNNPKQIPKYIDFPQSNVTYEIEGRKINWFHHPNGQKTPFDNHHFKYFNPYHPIEGLAPYEAAKLEADTYWSALFWNKGIFDNAGIPAGYIKLPLGIDMPQDEKDILTKMLNEKFGGRTKYKSMGIFSGGAEFVDLTKAQRDMEFNVLMRFFRENILSVLDVPPAVAGIFEYANYANSWAQIEYFWKNNLMPKIRYLENRINAFLRRFNSGLICKFKKESINALIEDMKLKTEIAERLWKIGVPFKDANERLELGVDVSDKEWLEQGWGTINQVPYELLSSAQESTEGKEQKSIASDAREIIRKVAWQKTVLIPEQLERGFQPRIKKHFYELRKEVLRNLDRVAKAGLIPQKDIAKQTQDEIVYEINFNLDEAQGKLKATASPYIKAATKKGGEDILAQAEIDMTFDFADPEVENFIRTKENKIKDVDETLWRRLEKQIRTGIGKGETVVEMGERIRKEFRISETRSLTIARTEMMESFNGGRYQASNQAFKRGIAKYIEWLSSRDARVRDTHRAIDRDVILYGETFRNGLQYPGDLRGNPAEVVNCRCSFNIKRRKKDE